MRLKHWGIISDGIQKNLLIFLGLGISPLLVILMLMSGKGAALPILSAAGLIFICMLIDLKLIIASGRSSWLLPLALVAPPAYSFLHQGANLLANMAGWTIFIFYFLLLPGIWKVNFWRRVISMGLPLMLFLTCLLISNTLNGTLPVSSDLFRSDGNTLVTWFGAAGYYLAACLYCKDEENIQRLLWLMMVIAMFQPLFILQAATGWFSFVPGLNSIRASGVNSQYGSFRDTELLAENMAISIVWVTTQWFSKHGWKANLSLIIMLFAFAFTGIMTGMRSFVVFTVIGVLMVVLLSLMRTHKVNRSMWFLIVVYVTTTAVWAVLPDWIGDWVKLRLEQTQSEFVIGNYFNRAPLYTATLAMARDMPFFGYGGNVNEQYHAFLTSKVSDPNVSRDVHSTHSMYSWALLTSGYPGFLALVFLFGSAMYYGYMIWRTGWNNMSMRLLSIGLMVSVVVMVFHEMKIEFARLNLAMFYFLVMFGVISAWYSLLFQYRHAK